MRDDFPIEVKRILAQRAGLLCSNPNCLASTSGPQDDESKVINIGVAAHITAASPGGARYNADLTVEQRKSAGNGIWLCYNCSKKIDDDESVFTVELLKAWKTVREWDTRESIGQTRVPPVESEADKKRRFLEPWVGKLVAWVQMNSGRRAEMLGQRATNSVPVTLIECNDLYAKINVQQWGSSRTISWSLLEIGHDDRLNCPEIQEYSR